MKLRQVIPVVCWTILALVVGGVVLYAVVFSQINRQIKEFALAELQKKCPELSFQIETAELVESQRVILRNIKAASKKSTEHSRPLFHIGELTIDAPITVQNLYQRTFPIEKITLRNTILRVTRSRSGQFDELSLLTKLQNSDEKKRTNPVEFENLIILYDDENVPGEPVKLVGNGRLTWQKDAAKPSPVAALHCTFQSDLLRRLTVDAGFDTETKHWAANIDCGQLDWNKELTKFIPFPSNYKSLPAAAARIDCQVQLQYTDSLRFSAEGNVSQGYADLPELNRTITGLTAKFSADNNGFRIEKLTAMGEASRIALSYVQSGLFRKERANLTANIQGLTVDEKIAAAISPFLNEKTRQLLEKFDFTSVADVHTELYYDGHSWKPKKVSLQVNELEFAYRDFPYKAEHLAGVIYIDEKETLNYRFTSRSLDLLKVNVEGHYRNLLSDAVGETVITAENVPIDDQLIKALPAEPQHLAEALHPLGKLNATLLFCIPEKPAGQLVSLPLMKEFDIVLNNAAIKFDNFPYPVGNIKGLLQYRNDAWCFSNVTGSNGSAAVDCSGTVQPALFRLNAIIKDLPVNQQLADAVLDNGKQQLLQSLKINGNANINAQIVYHVPEKKLDLKFSAIPCAGLSLCPDKFPYPVRNAAGEVIYDNGHVSCRKLTASNGETEIQTALDFQGNVLTLTDLHITQLTFNNELQTALPPALRAVTETLQIKKPVGIAGAIRFENTPQQTLASKFNLALQLYQNTLQTTFPAQNVSGTVHLTGQSVNNEIRLNGELNVPQLSVHQFPVTNFQGSFSYNGERIQLGVPGSRLNPNVPAKPLTADFFGGKMYSEGIIILGTKEQANARGRDLSYSINSALYGADLSKIAKQLDPASQKTSGTLNCTDINIQGVGTNQQNLTASGKIELRDANIYEAPAMMQVLRELGIRESNPNAGMFNSADINFKLFGNQIYFDPALFEGRLFSLFGNGTMQLDTRSLDLMMKTRIGNRKTQIPIISGIIGGVGDQIIQIKISGPVSSPSVSRVTLPNLNL
ncbi:hypothetical protein FACS189419_02750 [Planctomycetales bacterium]|nr:hypothetical protein FACS189419_02750 [Planctomycetales bacterium]